MRRLAKSAEEVMEKAQRGKYIAEVLQLRPSGGVNGSHDGALYRTKWGKKTAFGLYETVMAIVS